MKWKNFVLAVVESTAVAANLLRVEFEVVDDAGQGYHPIEPGDEAIALYFSSNGDELKTRRVDQSVAPGGWEVAQPERNLGGRNYTVRGYDERTRRIVVDIADHGHGPAIDWFRKAEPGWRVLAAGPRSWYSPPDDASHHILAGDLAALPALARILENTAPSIEVTVIAEVLDRSEIAYLPARPDTRMIEVIGSGNGTSPSRIGNALSDLDLPADGYLWFAGESADARAAKKKVRSLGWPRDRADIVGYWRRNSEAWMKKFEQSDPDRLRAVYIDAVAAGKSEEEATELFERAMEAAGL